MDPDLEKVQSNPIAPARQPTQPQHSTGSDLPTWRKCIILFVVSWMTLAVTFSSTSLLWGPLMHFLGRRLAYNLAILVLAYGDVSYRLWVWGQTMLADIFEPICQRNGRRVLFMMGTVTGPASGKFLFLALVSVIGGVIVTFSSWRNIYWLQTVMAGLGLVLSLLSFRS
ncbi:hypothetical protein P175DRAFT_0533054 [Aspergillus ochraceoroseus IBT 24754]|uniref:Major facilitator superfamily (MFS) profile domain-containing protein n=1 Tax=Aspergillus ochraceoroseus IBT 24754 TaxID=1392256 RepID=A0A2T5LUX6_9EURO|nr:uncharacterized protein P175DRAFT_0533054 [Aspergillus ochraceoroseus IBT 24754]PTU20080.1 hypothetical protein P175DRAFT_0533054 [Aspergillus ochraceoroseus IBT 24754]